MSEPYVRHHSSEHYFEISIDGVSAKLEYSLEEAMVIHHTFVPPELRGRKIAAQLTEAALSFAKQAQLEVVPQCSYTAAYIKRKSGASPQP